MKKRTHIVFGLILSPDFVCGIEGVDDSVGGVTTGGVDGVDGVDGAVGAVGVVGEVGEVGEVGPSEEGGVPESPEGEPDDIIDSAGFLP